MEWHTAVELVRQPNPKLSSAHQRVLELDYGMNNGEVVLSCRQALLFLLRQLGFSTDGHVRPEAQKVVLKNRDKVERFSPVEERRANLAEEGGDIFRKGAHNPVRLSGSR